jgi:hypothetical protein
MTYEEYVAAQTAINSRVAIQVLTILNPFKAVQLGPSAWLGLLYALFVRVNEARTESAELAREFYDAQRIEHVGNVHPIFRAEYDPDWFHEAMEANRDAFSQADASDGALFSMVSSALKEVENGGRRTILRAVDTDPQMVGWARVQGGKDSCAFCAMLISRGPVYKEAANAGLGADNVSAAEIVKQGDDKLLDELMSRWHDNCDCKVVPVYNRASWPGREQYLEAERIWAAVTGPYKGVEKLNAFRRAYESGWDGGQVPLPKAA